MKPHPLHYLGALLLFGCMVFAIARLDSADSWIALWVPFVIAGLALVFLGTFINEPGHTGRRARKRRRFHLN